MSTWKETKRRRKLKDQEARRRAARDRNYEARRHEAAERLRQEQVRAALADQEAREDAARLAGPSVPPTGTPAPIRRPIPRMGRHMFMTALSMAMLGMGGVGLSEPDKPEGT